MDEDPPRMWCASIIPSDTIAVPSHHIALVSLLPFIKQFILIRFPSLYRPRLAIFSWPCGGIPGLGPILNEAKFTLATQTTINSSPFPLELACLWNIRVLIVK